MALNFRKHIPWVSFFVLLFSCGISSADENHYNNFLIGDRASGMGGAYAAVSDDVSGLYYNPAGVVYSTGRNLSASVNAFYNQHKKYENVIAGTGWERNATALLPNFFGVTQPLSEKVKFGFSYAVPDSIQEDQDQIFHNLPSQFAGVTATTYVINFNNSDDVYELGPSLAMEVSKNFSAGVTLYYHERSNQTVLNQLITLSDGRYESTNFYSEMHERGLRPVVGVMWTPADKYAFGLALSKTMVSSSDVSSQSIFKDANALPNTIAFGLDSTSQKKKYPLQIRGGFAFFPSPSLLLTIDGIYHTKVNDAVFGDRVAVLNGAVGAEYYLNRNWAVRGGLYTDLSNTPEMDPTRSGQAETIDLYGGSVSISNFTRNTSITFGGNISTGSGQAQIISGSSNIQDASISGWTMFLSSSYSY